MITIFGNRLDRKNRRMSRFVRKNENYYDNVEFQEPMVQLGGDVQWA